ncbi:MAG: type II toxin-antitoxin system HicA family toxin [Alphaproteobacteria bacterium]|nr:type II toxin-antitoxin system HicA family toxin [Alphaproteobacteria bacterium]
MASLSYRELAKLLRQHGCEIVRQGKHEIWRTSTGKHFPVPNPIKGEGTLRKILKTAGIER